MGAINVCCLSHDSERTAARIGLKLPHKVDINKTQVKFVGRDRRSKVKVTVVQKVEIAKIIYTPSIFQLETSNQNRRLAPSVLEFSIIFASRSDFRLIRSTRSKTFDVFDVCRSPVSSESAYSHVFGSP